MSDQFKFNPIRSHSRSLIPLNKMHTTTGDFFRWDIAFALPLVPNDAIALNMNTFVDSGPNPFPINGSASFGLYAFFVPNRLVWKDWKFYKERLTPNLTKPYFTIGDLVDAFHSSANPWATDYFDHAAKYIGNIDNLASIIHFVYDYSSSSSVPTAWRNFKIDVMPLRMANRIWFDWMRDKVHISDNALNSYCLDTGGHITVSELIQLCAPRYRCFPKNFFTSSFDSPQEGLPGVVVSSFSSGDKDLSPAGLNGTGTSGTDTRTGINWNGTSLDRFSNITPSNTASSLGTQINDIRRSNALQQIGERMLIAGKTIKSRALALLGVSPTIEELQMSNYLGGHEEDLLFKTSMCGNTTSLNTGQSSSVGAFGYNPNVQNVAGQKFQNITTQGENGAGLSNVQYKTDEDGYLFVFSAITPHVQYYQGLPRNWTRGLETFSNDVNDYFCPDLENQPMQPVLNYEICAASDITPKNVFAWNLQYSDYKQVYDSLGGDFTIPTSAAIFEKMHLGRDIIDLVNELSIESGLTKDQCLTPANITQSSGYDVAQFNSRFTLGNNKLDHFIVNHKIKLIANRPMQKHCLPSLDSSLSANTSKDYIETGGVRL